MDEETVKAAFEKGEPPTASKEQLLDAVTFVCVCVRARAMDGKCVCARATAAANFSGLGTLQTRSVGAVVAKLATRFCHTLWSN